MKRARTGAFLCAAAALCVARGAPAAGRTIDAIEMSAIKIRIDGLLKEWPGQLTDLADTLQGSAGGDPRAAVSIGYDDKWIYVGLKIVDAHIVRTPAAGAGEDHATLIIAFPSGHGYATQQVEIYPGDPGHVAGIVKKGGAAVAGAKVVEAPAKNGLEVEAQIPWSAFPEASRIRVGLRGAVEYTDADSPGSIKAVIGTSTARSGGSLPPLRLDGEQAMDANLIRPNNLPAAPARVAYGDVNGDSMLEQVAVHGKYLTIAGPHYHGGNQFYFGEMGVSSSSMVDSLELRDMDGDGKAEIVVRKRIGGSDRYRGVIEVLKMGENDAPFRLFAHEIAIVTPDGHVKNKARLVQRGSGLAIEISQDEADGFEPDSYKEPVSDDMPSALLPWQSVASRTFAWDGKAFSQVDEKAGTPKVSAAKPHAPKKPEGPPPPPPPRPPTADELLDRVYALYRKDRHVGASKPRFDFVTDVVGDTRPERVLIHEKDIVVFGKGFRGGTSYGFITVGVADPKDILDATARDLTGDGKAEIIVRGVLHAKASKELGGDVVDRDALFVYRVTEQGVGRIFAAETGRALGDKRVLGSVAFVPAQHGLSIELKPGRAVGWTEENYPFPIDTTTAGGLEPLLLPWGHSSTRRYGYDGNGYALQ